MTQTEAHFWDLAAQFEATFDAGVSDAQLRSTLERLIAGGREVAASMKAESAGIPALERWHAKELESLQDAALFKLFNEGGADVVRAQSEPVSLSRQYFLVLRFLVANWLKQRVALGLSVGESRLLPPSARAAAAVGGFVWGYY